MRILVENGRLLDPSRELDVQESLWIEDGIICEKQAFSANQGGQKAFADRGIAKSERKRQRPSG